MAAHHGLAKDALKNDTDLYGMEDIPNCILQTVKLDIS